MKAFDLSAAFKAVAVADSALDGLHSATGQTADEHALPALIFDAKVKPLDALGGVLAFVVDIVVESNSFDSTAAQHAARVELAFQKFVTNRDAVATAIGAAGVFTVVPKMTAGESDPGIETHGFRTPMSLHGIVLVV